MSSVLAVLSVVVVLLTAARVGEWVREHLKTEKDGRADTVCRASQQVTFPHLSQVPSVVLSLSSSTGQ